MAAPRYLTVTLILIQSISAASVMKSKPNSRPVVEVINEPRSDTRTTKTPGSLPYGNPLTGQNARLHAQNQQAMFNAERIRQHRAQLQRWTKSPIAQMDSYMKAYHESQESHQMVLEEQQAKENQRLTTLRQELVTAAPLKKKRSRPESPRVKTIQATKFTKADAINDKNRSHRSYGSNYQQYLANKRYQNVFVSPASAYDQGVIIKPHGNIGISPLENKPKEPSKLYTEIIPSKSQYVYPKQYIQMQDDKSAQDYQALNMLLKQTQTDELNQLSSLLQSPEEAQKAAEIETPIDLYFYSKDQPGHSLSQHYEQTRYAQIPASYHAQKDHTPITEDVDDISDPNQNNRLKIFSASKPDAKPHKEELFKPESNLETTTVKSNNYYKVEVASQTISSGYKLDKDHNANPVKNPEFTSTYLKHPEYVTSQAKQHEYFANQAELADYLRNQENNAESTHSNDESEDKIKEYEALHYPHPTGYVRDHKEHEELSESYLHHHSQHDSHDGIQHLTEDGKEISAYGDDSLHYAANYEFGYRVRDQEHGNDFGHHEQKKGEKTKGAYHVLLPDGRMQKVQYSAGPEGFHADISYDHLQYRH